MQRVAPILTQTYDAMVDGLVTMDMELEWRLFPVMMFESGGVRIGLDC